MATKQSSKEKNIKKEEKLKRDIEKIKEKDDTDVIGFVIVYILFFILLLLLIILI